MWSVDVQNNKTAVKGPILLFEWKGDESWKDAFLFGALIISMKPLS